MYNLYNDRCTLKQQLSCFGEQKILSDTELQYNKNRKYMTRLIKVPLQGLCQQSCMISFLRVRNRYSRKGCFLFGAIAT